MTKLIIKREKTYVGMAVAMDCYINDVIVCKVKNGQEEECYVEDDLLYFKCGLPYNPMSEMVTIDAHNSPVIKIRVKQGGWKPEVTIENIVPTLETENLKETKGSVFSSQCILCGKTMKFFSEKIILKDGYVCSSCWNKKALNKRIESMTDSKNYTSRQIQNLVNTIENRTIDTSAFRTNTLISDLIQLDDSTQTVQIITKTGLNSATEYISYDQIVSFELIEDGETITKGGIGGVIAGGVMFGIGGAIVGSIISPKKTKPICNSLQIRISVKDYYTKVIIVKYIETPTKGSSTTYKEMHEKARKAIADLQVAVSMVQDDSKKTELSDDSSLADEIEKLYALYEKGILTEEEFIKAKKRVFDL